VKYLLTNIIVLVVLLVLPENTGARTDLQLPRFVSLKSEEANVRTGPGLRYKIKWVMVRKAIPLEVIAEFEQWRKVRDIQDEEGWIHRSLLTNKRNVIVTGDQQMLRKYSSKKSTPIARLEVGVNARLLSCNKASCRVSVNQYKGWIRKDKLWGVYPGEIIN